MARFSFVPTAVSQLLTADLAVVMPIYNEQANVRSVISEWMACLSSLSIDYKILALNDGSKDATLETLQEMESVSHDRLIVVDKINTGHGTTCRFGYEIAAASNTEWVLQIDSDGQCDPIHFRDFWQDRERYDCIFGYRIKRDDGFARVLTSKICSWGSSAICGVNLADANVPYRLIRRSSLGGALAKVPPHFNIHNVALTYSLKTNQANRWHTVPIHFRERRGGENSVNVLKVVSWGASMLLELGQIRFIFK